ncbi:hypothetical protein HY972_01700 [Candidatus Kaiserbacteria bacterium]|nr:hypothetical protein [Candidatus Kaiserbacteria bacterium]
MRTNRTNVAVKAAAVAVLLAMIEPASADNTANADASAGSNATAGAAANGNQLNANLNSGASAVTGPSSATATVGPSTSGATSVTGPSSAATGPVTTTVTPSQQTSLTINSESTKIPVALPAMPGVAVAAPQVFSFGPLSNPANINGVAASLYFERKCEPEYTGSDESFTDASGGFSGNTSIVFASLPDYKAKRTGESLKKVLPRFPSSAGNYVCIGTAMVTAKKGSESKVDINVVRDDVVKYVFRNLDGYSEIYVVSPEQSIGTALGTAAIGNGFSLGGAAAGIIGSSNPALGAVVGLAAAFSKTEASTHPDGRIGATYWILGKPKNPAVGTPFGSAEFAAFFAEMVKSTMPPSEGDGKKLEAIK